MKTIKVYFNFALMQKISFYIVLILTANLFLSKFAIAQKTELNAKEIIFKMIKSIETVERLKYSLKITERGKKGYNYYGSSVKLTRKPRKIYLYITGIELLWLKGWNNNKAYVKPKSFPFINLNLDPLGNLMRQDQHHTLNEMGFDYFGNIVEFMALKVGEKFDSYFKLEAEERYNNRPCYKISITQATFKIIST